MNTENFGGQARLTVDVEIKMQPLQITNQYKYTNIQITGVETGFKPVSINVVFTTYLIFKTLFF